MTRPGIKLHYVLCKSNKLADDPYFLIIHARKHTLQKLSLYFNLNLNTVPILEVP